MLNTLPPDQNKPEQSGSFSAPQKLDNSISDQDNLFDFSEESISLSIPEALHGPHKFKFFAAPNEGYPKEGEALMDNAPPGIYVAVGTERGFMSVALSDHATHLLLIDRDPQVVEMNRLNILLLKLSTSREDYLWLRFKATYDEWIERIQASTLEAQFHDLIGESTAHDFWRKNVRENPDFKEFHRNACKIIAHFLPFAGANYLYNDHLFERVHHLAKTNRIDTQVCDLSKPEDVLSLRAMIERTNQPIGTLDVSNAWWRGYISEEKVAFFLEQFGALGSPESIVLLTSFREDTKSSKSLGRWGYFGFTFGHIEQEPDKEEFVKSLRRYMKLDKSELGLQDRNV